MGGRADIPTEDRRLKQPPAAGILTPLDHTRARALPRYGFTRLPIMFRGGVTREETSALNSAMNFRTASAFKLFIQSAAEFVLDGYRRRLVVGD